MATVWLYATYSTHQLANQSSHTQIPFFSRQITLRIPQRLISFLQHAIHGREYMGFLPVPRSVATYKVAPRSLRLFARRIAAASACSPKPWWPGPFHPTEITPTPSRIRAEALYSQDDRVASATTRSLGHKRIFMAYLARYRSPRASPSFLNPTPPYTFNSTNAALDRYPTTFTYTMWMWAVVPKPIIMPTMVE